MLCGCEHSAITIHRTATFARLSTYIRSLVSHSMEHLVAVAYRSLLDPLSPLEPHLVWAGTLTPTHVSFLREQSPPYTGVIHPSHPVYRTLKKLSGMVLQGSLSILSARHAVASRLCYHRR